MSFQVSPGVNVREVDLTNGVQNESTTDAGFAGAFPWGPCEDVKIIQSEDDLVAQFGKPDANTAEYFFTAANFLAYGAGLRVVRVLDSDKALNATSDYGAKTGTVTINSSSNVAVGSGTSFNTELSVGQVIKINDVAFVVGSITNATQMTLTTVPAANATANTLYAAGLYVKNHDDYDNNYSSGEGNIGVWMAKYPGALGNSLRVSVCASANAFASTPTGTISGNATSTTVVGSGTAFTTQVSVGDVITVNSEDRQVTAIANTTQLTVNAAFSNTFSGQSFAREWKYNNLFDAAPGTTEFASNRGGAADELHVVVVDEDGAWTGTPNTVLERWAFMSKASDAKNTDGSSNYYKNIINARSKYIWWMDHPATGTDWGNAATGETFDSPYQPLEASLVGGQDGTDAVSAGDLVRGYDKFVNKEDVDVALLIAPPFANTSIANTVANHIISNVAEVRGDCVVYLSPPKTAVVDNANNEATSVVAFRSGLPSSSYAVMDSGWKYQLDKYNDVYRWVPLCGDVAGLAARTDRVSDPWYSQAGHTRGNIKNVIKLAFNPKQLERDDLYRKGVNPVVNFKGQGTVLYGDKTMLSRPSAFDRINVRRLFIVLRKTIERAAQATLFEFNDELTRNQFVNIVEPFLRDVRARRGITDFKVLCDESNNTPDVIDRNEFRADIYIKPNRSINYIQLNFVAVRGNVSFSEVVPPLSEI